MSTNTRALNHILVLVFICLQNESQSERGKAGETKKKSERTCNSVKSESMGTRVRACARVLSSHSHTKQYTHMLSLCFFFPRSRFLCLFCDIPLPPPSSFSPSLYACVNMCDLVVSMSMSMSVPVPVSVSVPVPVPVPVPVSMSVCVYTYIYVWYYLCLCACVCVCVRTGGRIDGTGSTVWA